MENKPKCSLILTTYNNVSYLECSLNSILKQDQLPDEIIVADDGSKKDTEEFITNFNKKCPVPVVHVWHSDEGFQLSKIRNRAIKQAQHPYIIQTDGDLFFHKRFIKDHIKFARKGYFTRGGRTLLNDSDTQKTITSNTLHLETSKVGKIASYYSIPLLRDLFCLLSLPK
ncbi:MAG: glycosyltransferase, partial [Akkermansiaceae bacterium]